MKAYVDERKCPAQEKICPILTSYPKNAVTYQMDKAARLEGRIVIDLERCDGCGQCITDCCGQAMELRG